MHCLRVAHVGIFMSDENMVIDSLWAYCYLTDCGDEAIECILSSTESLN